MKFYHKIFLLTIAFSEARSAYGYQNADYSDVYDNPNAEYSVVYSDQTAEEKSPYGYQTEEYSDAYGYQTAEKLSPYGYPNAEYNYPTTQEVSAYNYQNNAEERSASVYQTPAEDRFFDDQLNVVTDAIGGVFTQIGFAGQGIFMAIESILPMPARALLDSNLKRTAANMLEYARIAMQGYINIVRTVRDLFRVFYYFGEFIADPENFDVFRIFQQLNRNSLIRP